MATNDEIGIGLPDLPEGADSVEIVMAGHHGPAVVPRGVNRLRGDQLEVAADLQRKARQILDLQAEVVDLLREGRELGMAWNTLGWLIGLTNEGARQMVARADREAEMLGDE